MADAAPYSWRKDKPFPNTIRPTSDLETVRKVLAKGASREVHHTLKSQLAEDEVRKPLA